MKKTAKVLLAVLVSSFSAFIVGANADGLATSGFVGDANKLGSEGDGIVIKYDDLSLAEKDLIKIVGREYIGLGIVADHAFCKVNAPA